MNVPKLRFKEFDGEVQYEKTERFFKHIRNGFVGTATPYYTDSSGIKYLQSNNIKDGQINEKNIVYINEEFHKKHEKNTLKIGDLLVVQSGHAGDCAVVNEKYINCNCHALIIMTPNSQDEINTEFLNVYMHTSKGKKELNKLITGNTIKHILASDMKKFNFPNLQIEEQKKIAAFFKILDKKIQLQQQKIDLLQEQKKGYMQKVFRQELKFKGERNKNYSDWNTHSLSELSVINPKSSNINDEFIYIDLESVKGGKLVQEKVILKEDAPSRAQRVIKNKDILYQMVRPYQKNNLIFERECEKQIIASTGYAQIRVKENVNPVFIYYLMNTEEFTYRVLQRCTGTSYPAINSNDLSEIEIKVPVLEEQEKIAVFMCKLDKKIHLEYQKLELLYEQKQGFMQQMFI